MSAVVAYLYHDAASAEAADPLLHSTLLVLARDRRPNCRNETPLVTLEQAEAMVAAERERWRSAIAPEIPADMKDWHENSPDEWPQVAAAVLRGRREDAETAWGMLAEWREREKELMRWKSTHAPRLKALEGLWHAAQREADASREAVATLSSERAANALLTDEVERLRGDVAAERDRIRALVEAVRDANAAEAHGDYTFRVLTAQQERAWVELMDALNVLVSGA